LRKTHFILILLALPVLAQSNTGELRLRVTDPTGLGVRCKVELVSQANQFRQEYTTDGDGNLLTRRLPLGLYRIEITNDNFAPYSQLAEVRSAVPAEYAIKLSLASVNTSVTVTDQATLIDPERAGTVNRIGEETIENRLTSLPGRSLQDLVNSQPGWLYEGNAVLHPRGSEYQTQVVVDGVPLTDNRSPGFAPEIEADNLESLSIYTANFPAEYGRKMGGVIELTTKKDTRRGLHGEATLSGGSFDTGGAYAMAQYMTDKNTFGVSANGDFTARYLNPPVAQNFTNVANTGDLSARYEHDFSDKDHLSLLVRHELARFDIPNEQVQEQAGQVQTGAETETSGTVSYQHVFSANVLGTMVGMVRDDADSLQSNQFSTPIIAFQNRGFREGYVKGSISVHHGRHEWKAGVEADFYNLHEAFSDVITDPSQFDPGTPASFNFFSRGYDREQAAFVQDLVRLGNWSLSAGVRWDHYQLLVDKNAVSPRLGVAHYFPTADLVVHASYDRIFQTPAFENILLSSSPEVQSLDPKVLRLPVQPSLGNYYEVGMTKALLKTLKFDASFYERRVNNFADDDQLLNTAVSFPIAFNKASIYGAEGKLDLPHWKRWSGYVSYSYMVASAYFPVTGGLFLGDDASAALSQLGGRFWVSQDQRNTVRTRFRYEVTSRVWAAAGTEYGSGLPFEFDGTEQQALAQYGQAIVDRVNFVTGRVRPQLAVNLSAGVQMYQKENIQVRFQADVQNLNNRLNVIDFAGLFSGNAVAPPRSFALRLTTGF
jgi:hypothetical protein